MYIANNYGTWLNKERSEGAKTIKFLQGLQSKSKATKLVKYIVKGKWNSVVGEAKTFEQEILLMVVINTYPPPPPPPPSSSSSSKPVKYVCLEF